MFIKINEKINQAPLTLETDLFNLDHKVWMG